MIRKIGISWLVNIQSTNPLKTPLLSSSFSPPPFLTLNVSCARNQTCCLIYAWFEAFYFAVIWLFCWLDFKYELTDRLTDHLYRVNLALFLLRIWTPSCSSWNRNCVDYVKDGDDDSGGFTDVSRQLSSFSLCSSGLISALLVLSTTYLFMKVSFSPDVILCGWLSTN